MIGIFFMSQRPRKLFPTVMSATHETPCFEIALQYTVRST